MPWSWTETIPEPVDYVSHGLRPSHLTKYCSPVFSLLALLWPRFYPRDIIDRLPMTVLKRCWRVRTFPDIISART